MQSGVFWSNAAEFFITPWGAGLAKYKRIANKPGLVLAGRLYQLRGFDLGIYHASHFMEDPLPMTLIDIEDVEDVTGDSCVIPIDEPQRANFIVNMVGVRRKLSHYLRVMKSDRALLVRRATTLSCRFFFVILAIFLRDDALARDLYSNRVATTRSTPINLKDFHISGHVPGEAASISVDSQRTIDREITINKTLAVQEGDLVAGSGISWGTRIIGIKTDMQGKTILFLSIPTLRRLQAGEELLVGQTDDTPAFLAAITEANQRDIGNVIYIPSGNYILSKGTLPPTYGRTTWIVDPAAVIYGSEIPGFWGKLNFASGTQGLALGRNDVSPGNSNILYLSQDIGNSGTRQPAEKDVLNVDCTDGDSFGSLTTNNSDDRNIANTNTACIGYHAEVRLGNFVHGATLWASQYNLRIPFGTDGYAVALEYGLENGGSYAPEIGQGETKVGIKAICSGPQDCTTANEYETAGGLFHMFERFYQPALRHDGWAWMYEAVGYRPLADLDYQGNLYAQSLRAADVTVASLSHACQPGQIVHTIDGRKPGELVDGGSGVDAECERVGRGVTTTAWFSMMGGTVLQR